MKLLLLYPPFAPPSIMPYSIVGLKSFIEANSSIKVKAVDLNAKFHKLKGLTTLDKIYKALPIYERNNRDMLDGKNPEFFDELLGVIKEEKPDYVAFSLVYNSQCFYAKHLIQKLDCKVFLGGPAVSPKLQGTYMSSSEEFLSYLGYDKVKHPAPEFSDFSKEEYISPEVIPVKSSDGCPYGKCVFCSHHNKTPYRERELDLSKGRYFFFIDDMIPLERLIKIGEKMPTKAVWWVQLRPTADLIPHLEWLSKKGLKSVAWGVESGSQRMLKKMNKGTSVDTISRVLAEAKRVGIINTVYVMFGFPGESEEDFFKTLNFLEENSEHIDLVSPSTFGLQKGTKIYENPEVYGIRVFNKKRTILDDKINFTPIPSSVGLKKKYKKRIEKINKLPKAFAYLKEQTLFV
ncbi:MAG: B12-binding domain-containing radical SAM protein [Nanoarchaeota archaeon]